MYEFVEDTIEVVPTPEEKRDFGGDYTTLEIKETGEKLVVLKHPTEGILVYPVKGSVKNTIASQKSIAHIAVKEGGYILNYYVAPDYRKYGLGKYLLEKALNEYHGWWLLCGGTTAYKLYRKYGFVPVANYGIKVVPKDDKIIKACLNTIKNAPARNEKVSEIVTMVLKDHLKEVGLTWNKDLEKFTEYVDANYHGVYDSAKYVFEKVGE